ncbi:MAG: hypothetical protein JNJ48_06505 [Phycisphaerae bacterium]|nr:hypothetical protein [Phycisphaerae bacterium]
MTRRPPATAAARSAFSMIEIVVVVALLAIVGGVIVPRLVSTGARQAQVEAQAVRAMLSAAAQRDALSNQSMALEYDGATRELSLWVQLTGENEGDAVWAPAPLVRPVRVETGQLRSVAIDGRAVNAPQWRIDFPGGQPRPSLSVLIVFDGSALGGNAAWQVDLPPDATAAMVTPLPGESDWRPATSNSGVDLDATGRRSTPW